MNEKIISVKGLNKQFQGKDIIKNVSFSIERGSIYGLLGPNGSGKTTMIRLLNGVIEANGGEILIDGRNPRDEGEWVRKHSGIVTETTNLYHELSAWDNLMFFSDLYGVKGNERAEELLKEFGMWEHRLDKVGSFSTGMKKRISLAKALLHKPSILFLDEPTNGLDPEGIKMVLEYLKKINKQENTTIVICSHVLHQMEGLCDSFLFIKKGVVIENGKRKDIEKRHLKQLKVVVETGLEHEDKLYNGFPCEIIGSNLYQFTIQSKEDISKLLRLILQETWVTKCELLQHDLDALYFLIGGEALE